MKSVYKLPLQTAMEYTERVNNWIVWNSLINLKIEK